MLDGLLFSDGALRAGRTSSPDFFRINGGLIWRSSPPASSASLSEVLRPGDSNLVRGKSKKALVSVLDLECEIFRAPADKGRLGEGSGCDSFSLLPGSIRSPGRPKATLALFLCSLASLFGEPARCCSIILMAACSSAKFATSLTLPRLAVASSSLEVEGEDGGEISVETIRWSAEDGRTLPVPRDSLSASSLSELLGSWGVASGVDRPVLKPGEFEMDGLRRCLFRYAREEVE